MRRLNESRISAVINERFAVRLAKRLDSGVHAQHGTGIVIGLDADVAVTTQRGDAARGRVVAISPNVPHSVSSHGPALCLLYDPELSPRVAHFLGRAQLKVVAERRAQCIVGAMAAERAALYQPQVLTALALEIEGLFGVRIGRKRDGRILRLVETLRDPEADARCVVAASKLSPQHLRALFVREVGIPMRTYRLWRKLLFGMARFASCDATTAAHDAGFSDLAHFSRTARRMFGESPTALGQGLLEP